MDTLYKIYRVEEAGEDIILSHEDSREDTSMLDDSGRLISNYCQEEYASFKKAEQTICIRKARYAVESPLGVITFWRVLLNANQI